MGKPKEKGASSPASSGENSSLLDFDLNNDDFLNSWKPKSGGEANLMDIDFGSPVKSKNKAFGFDKMDMDFNLDSGFGKLSSINIDMPDLDVSSPLKRGGKHKEKFKDASGKENNKGKADSFDFSFDFMDFDFKSDAKTNKKNVEDEDDDDSPKKDDHQGAKIQLAEEIGGLEVELSEKPTMSGNFSSSNTTNLYGGTDLDSTKEAVSHQSMIKENGPSENLTVGYVAAASGGKNHDSTEGNVSMKSIGYDDTFKGPTAENVATLSGVLRTSNDNAHVGGDPRSTDESTALKSTGNDNGNTKLQTESMTNKTLISTEIQQTDCQADETSPGGAITTEVGSSSPLLEHSVHSTCGTDSGEHTRIFQEEDIVASITVSDEEHNDHENVTADSSSRNEEVVLEKSSQHIANAESQHLIEVHDANDNMEGLEQSQSNPDLKCPPKITMANQMLLGGGINEDPIINVPMPSTNRTKVDSAIPGSEGLITRSKYFTGSSKTASELPKSTPRVPKLNSFGSKFVPNTKQSLTAEPKLAAPKSSTAISSGITLQVERSTLVMSAYAKPLLSTSTIIQPAERSTSTTSANAKPSLPNRIPLKKNIIVEPEKVATTKTVQKLPDLSGIENSRTLRTIDLAINQKEDKPMGSTGSNKRLLGNMASKISPLATPRQQTLVSLKRKTPEAPDSVEVLVNHPKRHSDSSIASRRLLETSEICVDKEDGETLDRGDPEGVIRNRLLPPVQILPELNMQNLGSPYSIKDDNNVEEAEACSKELEYICNMLRKKHEEAKDLLVRAIVNNNKLLMLNHPLNDEKIRMIQQFASCLSLGS